MSDAFESVIGYEEIKTELRRLCDILKDTEKYRKLGVHIPSGLLLQGEPGTGKTTMARCFIEESGRKCFTCRKTKSSGKFLEEIVGTFADAGEEAPSIVFLDDIDKFTDKEGRDIDAEEFVTIQSCMDEIRDRDVFVIATANEFYKLPNSLCRSGRFGKVIPVGTPTGKDAEDIVRYYLSGKAVAEDIDIRAISRMLNGQSCATLEEVVNEAGILAGYQGKDIIGMDDMLEAILNEIFDAPKSPAADNSFAASGRVAYHEAGHIVIAELFDPGSVTVASIRNRANGKGTGGFAVIYPNGGITERADIIESNIIRSLGGKAATEIVYGTFDPGCNDDLHKAFRLAGNIVDDFCAYGFDKWETHCEPSDNTDRKELAVAAELDRAYAKAKTLLIENRSFLDALAKALAEKDTIIAKDIEEIRAACEKAA